MTEIRDRMFIPPHGDVDMIAQDVTLDGTKPSMLRFIRGVVLYRCRITDSMMFGPVPKTDDWRGHSVFLRVFIPECYLNEFRLYVNPFEMKKPPKVHVGVR